MRKKKPDPLEEVNLLELAPVRAARWQEKDDRVVVERPRPRIRGPRDLLHWLGYQMATRRIRLDPVGSLAWKSLDGKTTVQEVTEVLRREFGEEVEPVEERLGRLIHMMRREGLVAYPGWDPLPDPPVEGG